MNQTSASPLVGTRTTARAFFVSERLNTSGLERGDVLATTPLAFRVNENGVAILFGDRRYVNLCRPCDQTRTQGRPVETKLCDQSLTA